MKPALLLALKNKRHAMAGFTLIEMVMVLTLIGIFGMVSMPKMLGVGPATLDSQARAFASDLRRTQLLASVRGISLCVQASGTHYSIEPCTQPGVPIIDPATGQSFVGDLKNGVQFTNTAIVPPLAFNSAGQPNHATRYVVGANASTSTLYVDVAALTGYVSTAVGTP